MAKRINEKPLIIQALRSLSIRWWARNEALKNSRVSRGNYQCAECGEEYKKKHVHLDHIEAVVDPAIGWVSYDEYIRRLFCKPEGFQVLCTSCHSVKSEQEDELRKFHKRFVPLIGHEEMYVINKKGVLKKGAKKTKRKVEPQQAESGRYYYVIDNETLYVDELIMRHFTDDWFEGCTIKHKNFNTSDNLFSNLEVVVNNQVSKSTQGIQLSDDSKTEIIKELASNEEL